MACGEWKLLLARAHTERQVLAALPSQHLKPYAYLVFAAVLFPIKFLDYFFIRSNRFNSLAPTFLVYARKRSENG